MNSEDLTLELAIAQAPTPQVAAAIAAAAGLPPPRTPAPGTLSPDAIEAIGDYQNERLTSFNGGQAGIEQKARAANAWLAGNIHNEGN